MFKRRTLTIINSNSYITSMRISKHIIEKTDKVNYKRKKNETQRGSQKEKIHKYLIKPNA